MSWINSNATYKQNSKNDLSFYHGFSKTPVEPNTSTGNAATTLANASTKGGHTVIGTEVWAEEIPWFGLVPSRAVAVTRLSGLTKLNDLVKVDGEGGKVYKYKGADDATFTEDTWADFWEEVTLTNGMTLNNRHNQPVLRYYLNQPMQTLTTTNNASIDSKGFATRLFVNEETHVGQTSGGAVVSQFAAGTDNIKNGIPSVELNPKLYLGTTEKIAGTHYYDYNVSGTILWSTAVTSSSPKISCFRYIGKTVTGQLATVDTTVKSHALDIADIKLALGMNPNPDSPTTSVTARVETVEDVVRVLLGLGDSDAIAATESISTTANSAATNAINSALADGGSIAQAIATAKEQAIANAKVTLTAGNGITIPNSGSQDTAFTISVDTDVIATKKSVDDLSDLVSALPATIEAAQDAADAAMEEAQKKVASVSGPATGLVTVTGDKEVTITVSDTIATKTDAATAATTAVNGLKETAITSQSVSGAGVSVTLGGKVGAPTLTGSVTPATYTSATKTWTNDSNVAKASDVSAAISDAVNGITIPSVTTSTAAQTVGVTASGHEVSVATADYTASTDTWTNKSYLVTGATVEAFVNDVVSEVSSDLTTLENKVNAYHKAGVSYKIYTATPLPDLSIEDNVKEYKNVILLVPKNQE